MNRARDFYGSGLGDRLIDEPNLPTAIRLFLVEERRFLERVAGTAEALIEVGCMHGRHLDWCVRRRIRYVGIDVIPRYIELGQRTVRLAHLDADAYRFVLGEAEELDRLVGRESSREKETSLIFFPFNSFGNVDNPVLVAKSLAVVGCPFFVSTYLTTENANRERARYYQSCQYNSIRSEVTEHGIRFVSLDGLNSMAYHPEYLRRVWADAGLTVAVVTFGEIGVAYSSEQLFELGV